MAKPLATIMRALAESGTDFVVVGGVAVNAHGFNRATLDLDIIVRFDRSNVHRLVTCLRGEGYTPRTPVDPEQLSVAGARAEWRNKNMVALAFFDSQPPYTAVDVFIDHPIDYDEMLTEAVQVEYDGALIRICSVRHLIDLKERARRPKDLEDLKFLYRIFDEVERKHDGPTPS
ncbi:MAG TPA: hypothetical protein VF595_00560 [Tepidisphaeraceae bacterium]